MEVNSAATQVTAKPCDLPSAPLAVVAAFAKDAKLIAGKVELGNHAGIALSARFAEGAPTVVPAGKYHVTSASLTLADASGKKWDAAFSCPRAVEILPDTGASLTFGMPIKVEPVVSTTMMNPNDAVNVYKLGGHTRCRTLWSVPAANATAASRRRARGQGRRCASSTPKESRSPAAPWSMAEGATADIRGISPRA